MAKNTVENPDGLCGAATLDQSDAPIDFDASSGSIGGKRAFARIGESLRARACSFAEQDFHHRVVAPVALVRSPQKKTGVTIPGRSSGDFFQNAHRFRSLSFSKRDVGKHHTGRQCFRTDRESRIGRLLRSCQITVVEKKLSEPIPCGRERWKLRRDRLETGAPSDPLWQTAAR